MPNNVIAGSKLAMLTKGYSRMAIGGMNRTPRVFPDTDIDCCGWTIPKGVSFPSLSFVSLSPGPRPRSAHTNRYLTFP